MSQDETVDTIRTGRVATSVSRPLTPLLTVVHHDDPSRVGDVAALRELVQGRRASISRLEPAFHPVGGAGARGLADPRVSRRPLSLERAGDGLRVVPDPDGTPLAVHGVPVDGPVLLSEASLRSGVVLDLAGAVLLVLRLVHAPPTVDGADGLIGASDAMCRLREAVGRAADTGVTVLVRGETGTGKELVARALHTRSRRSAAPFVAANVAALSAGVAASELFGHTRGAFTGATHDRDGLFVRAQGGTLFLDEVGDAPDEIQLALLRVLESQEALPVGGRRPVALDVRVVAATDAPIEERVASGRLRMAFVERIAGYRLEVPPLRERVEDLGRLAKHLVEGELRRLGDLRSDEPLPSGRLSHALMGVLLQSAWPGNVRQLQNVLRQLVIESRAGGPLCAEDARRLLALPAHPSLAHSPPTSIPDGLPVPAPVTVEPGRDELLRVLETQRWDLSATARALGVARNTLLGWVDRTPGLRRAKDLGPTELLAALDAAQGDVDAAATALRVSARALILRRRELGL